MNLRHPAVLSRARAAGLGCLALFAVRAAAQTTPPVAAETVQLPTFTVSTTQDVGYRAGNSVSATRIDTPIKDLPFTISAFTEQFIEDIGALDLQDVLRFAPGVTSGDKSFVAGNNRFSIRGFDGDVPPQRNGFTGNRNVDSANVARVEVIKGPASLLYGQIIPGGTVNYITKRPVAKPFVSIKQTFGNESDYRTVVDVNTPLGSRIGARVVASYNQDPQWAVSGRTKSWLIAPSLSFQLTKKISLILDYEKLHREETPPLGMMPNVQIAGFSGAPSASTFVNIAARSYQQGLYDAGAINRGFLGAIPIASTFNYQGDRDYKKADYENMNVELNAQLGGHCAGQLQLERPRDALQADRPRPVGCHAHGRLPDGDHILLRLPAGIPGQPDRGARGSRKDDQRAAQPPQAHPDQRRFLQHLPGRPVGQV